MTLNTQRSLECPALPDAYRNSIGYRYKCLKDDRFFVETRIHQVSVPLPGFKCLKARHLESLLNKGCRTTFGKGDLKSRSQPLFYSDGEFCNSQNY